MPNNVAQPSGRKHQRQQRRNERQRQQQHMRITGWLGAINDGAYRASQRQTERARIEQAQAELASRNQDEAEARLYEVSRYRIYALALLGVYFIDFVLLRATAEFLLSFGFDRASPMFAYGKWIIPAGMLLLMLAIACKISFEREEEAEDNRRPWRSALIRLAGFAIPVADALLVAAMYWRSISNQHELTSLEPGQAALTISTEQWLILIALSLISLLIHAFTLLSVNFVESAVGYYFYALAATKLRLRERLASWREDRQVRRLLQDFTAYRLELERYNQANREDQIQGGPFTQQAVNYINQHFPGAIADGGQPPAAPPPGALFAMAAPPGDQPPAGAPFTTAPSVHANGFSPGDGSGRAHGFDSAIRQAESEVTL